MYVCVFVSVCVEYELIVQGPFVFLQICIHHLLHREVWDQLVLRQFHARHRIKVADALQMLLDVLALVRDARRRDHRLTEDLETDLAAQIVGHVAFLPYAKIGSDETTCLH